MFNKALVKHDLQHFLTAVKSYLFINQNALLLASIQ